MVSLAAWLHPGLAVGRTARTGVSSTDATRVDDRGRVCARQPGPARGAGAGCRAGPAHARLPRPVIDVVFAGSGTVGAQGSQGRIRRPGGIDLGVRVERRLVGPELEYDELIRVEGALKNLKLLAAGLLLHGAAALGHG